MPLLNLHKRKSRTNWLTGAVKIGTLLAPEPVEVDSGRLPPVPSLRLAVRRREESLLIKLGAYKRGNDHGRQCSEYQSNYGGRVAHSECSHNGSNRE